MSQQKGGIKSIVFDCDGVMVDSRAANAEFFNRVLQYFDLPPLTAEQDAYTFMATARQALEYIVPKQYHTQLTEVCRTAVVYERDILPILTLMPGFLPFVQDLHEKHIRLGIHTNRSRIGIQRIINKFGLEPYFSAIVTADDAEPKPSPAGLKFILQQWYCAPDEVLFVGDSPHDKNAAAGAGVRFAAFGNAALTGDIAAADYSILAEKLRVLL